MDHKSSKEGDPDIDLESGRAGEEETTDEPLLADNKRAKSMVRYARGVLGFDGSDKANCSTNSYNNSGNKSSEDQHDDIEVLIVNNIGGQSGEHLPLMEKTQVKEKHKTGKLKKAPKPPRPRKGPSLDTADMKYVKEIAELAVKKRARVERLKALKKMKAAKSSSSSSSNTNLFAMVVTLLFCLVIIFQGVCSVKNSSSSLKKSPEPSAATTNDLISVQLYNNILESNGIGASFESHTSVEQSNGPEFRSTEIERGRVIG